MLRELLQQGRDSGMADDNPFKPSFGVSPPVLAGRGHILDELDDAFSAGPGHPDYTSLLVGVRGAGKTATLNAVQQRAVDRGWKVISENAHGDMCTRLIEAARRILSESERSAESDRPTPRPRPRVAGVRALGIGVEFERSDQAARKTARETEGHEPVSPRLRPVLTRLASRVASDGRGVLITLDELQSALPGQLREFAATLQHVTRREEMPVAFTAAGLPSIDDVLLQDSAVTFLQRCSRYEVGDLTEAAAATAFAEPIKEHGGRITGTALRRAVHASAGYPFMVQLIGFHAWKAAAGDPVGIDQPEITTGIAEAERRLPRLVLAPMWRAMSLMDRRFASAMAIDEGDSATSDIAARLDRSTGYTSTYRSRLIRAGLIRSTGHGRVGFVHRITRTWLRSGEAPW